VHVLTLKGGSKKHSQASNSIPKQFEEFKDVFEKKCRYTTQALSL